LSSPDTATRALRIAVVGAESTGKSTLVQALAARLVEDFGLRAVGVPEYLRAWCDAHGRTPSVQEQREVADAQQAAIEAAAEDADVVVADTTPLMTAVYSRFVFGDDSLDAVAREAHASIDFTLHTALDLPWVADGLMRDGPHVREPVDRQVRSLLVEWVAPWAVVQGLGDARTESALEALRPLLAAWGRAADAPQALFTSLLSASTGPRRIAPLRVCELCDDPGCEHLLQVRRT
jgi:nicotinamide riboside kinase